MKIRYSAKAFIASLAILALMATASTCVYAQGQQTMPLKSNQLAGEVEASGQSYFYTFFAGPGNVSLSLNGVTDYYSSTLHVIVNDETRREVANVEIAANTNGSRKTAELHLGHRQKLKMSVLLGTNPGVQLKYKVDLAGAVSFDEAIASTDTGSGEAVAGQDDSTSKLASVSKDIQVSGDVKDEKQYNSPVEDKWALLVGVSKYEQDSINLKYPAKDAQDLHDYLIKEANFAPDHVKILVNAQATKEHVMEEIGDKWLPRVAHPNDLVLIFISCHGSPSSLDLEGLNYLVLYNTNPDSLFATGLPLQQLATVIHERVHSNRVVVIIDACHSGAATTSKGITRVGNVDSLALSQGTGQLVICSSKPDQVSWESKRYPNGVFTHQLIQALRTNSGRAKLGDVFARLKESVLSEVLDDRKELQTPILNSKWQGNDLVLTAPATKPRNVPKEIDMANP